MLLRLKRKYIWIGAAVICIAAFFCFFQELDEKIENIHRGLNPTDYDAFDTELCNRLETGDWIFRKGYGWVSEVIQRYSQTGDLPLSHVGLIVRNRDSLNVVHAVSNREKGFNGVVLQKLADFQKAGVKNHTHIVRIQELTMSQKRRIRKLSDTSRYQGVKFDPYWDWDKSDRLFCSELILNIFDEANVIDWDQLKLPQRDYYMDFSNMYRFPKSKVVYSTLK